MPGKRPCKEELAHALRVIAELEKSLRLIQAIDGRNYQDGYPYALGIAHGEASLGLAAIPEAWRRPAETL